MPIPLDFEPVAVGFFYLVCVSVELRFSVFEMRVCLYQQIPGFFLFVESAFLQLVQASHVCGFCQFLLQGVEFFDLLRGKELEELVGDV